MTKILSYSPNSECCKQLPGSAVAGGGDATTEGAKGQPSPRALVNGGNNDGRSEPMYTIVSVLMACFLLVSDIFLWSGDWHEFAIAAIAFLYSTVMISLLFVKRHNEAKMKQELEACAWINTAKSHELTSVLMMVATGITLTSLGVTVFLFRPKWRHLAIIVLAVSVSTALTILIVGALKESERKTALRAKCEDTSDLV